VGRRPFVCREIGGAGVLAIIFFASPFFFFSFLFSFSFFFLHFFIFFITYYFQSAALDLADLALGFSPPPFRSFFPFASLFVLCPLNNGGILRPLTKHRARP